MRLGNLFSQIKTKTSKLIRCALLKALIVLIDHMVQISGRAVCTLDRQLKEGGYEQYDEESN